MTPRPARPALYALLHLLSSGWRRLGAVVCTTAIAAGLTMAVLGIYSDFTTTLQIPTQVIGDANRDLVPSTSGGLDEETIDAITATDGVSGTLPYLFRQGFIGGQPTLVIGLPATAIEYLGATEPSALPTALTTRTFPDGHAELRVADLGVAQVKAIEARNLPKELQGGVLSGVTYVDSDALTSVLGRAPEYDGLALTVSPAGEATVAAVAPTASLLPLDHRERAAQNAAQPFQSPLLAIAGFVAVIGGVVAVGQTAMLAEERRRDLAVLKAIGMDPSTVRVAVAALQLVLGTVGGVIGVGVGIAVGSRVTNGIPSALTAAFSLESSSFTITPQIVVASIGAAVVPAVLGSVLAGRAIRGVSPLEALQDGPPAAGSRRTSRFARALAGALFRLRGAGPIAAGAVARDHRRTFSIVAVVTLCVASVVTVYGVAENLVETTLRRLSTVADTDLFVEASSGGLPLHGDLTADDLKSISSVEGVASATGSRYALVEVKQGTSMLFEGIGGPSHTPSFSELAHDEQAEVLGGDGVALSSSAARTYALGEGDLFELPDGSQRTVVSVIAGPEWADGVVIMSRGDMERLGYRSLSLIEVQVDGDRHLEEVSREIQASLVDMESGRPVFVSTGEATVEEAKATLSQARVTLLAIRWLLVIAAMLMVGQTIAIGVERRRLEFGQFLAIGASRRLVTVSAVVETLLLILIGLAIGCLGGLVGHYAGVRALGASGYAADYALKASAVPAALVAMAVLAIPSLVISAAIASRVHPSVDGRLLA